MKKLAWYGAAVAASMVWAMGASAADVRGARPAYPAKAPAPVYAAPIYDWTGFYVGIFGGGGWGRHDLTNPASAGYDSQGGLVGGTLGYNWQTGPLVLGVEGDLGWSNISGGGVAALGNTNESELQWLGSVRGRVGYAVNNLLLYGTGGWAFGDIKNTNNNLGAVEQFTVSRSGWTAGGGAEYAFAPNWSAKLEYRYTDLGNYSNGAPANLAAPYSVDNQFQTVTVGLNYKWGGPPVSRY